LKYQRVRALVHAQGGDKLTPITLSSAATVFSWSDLRIEQSIERNISCSTTIDRFRAPEFADALSHGVANIYMSTTVIPPSSS
jgi:hypothetical protein